jgi:hypothetical protein
MGLFKDRRLKRDGLEAIGVVVSAQPLHNNPESAVVPYRLRLRVSGDGRDEREVELEATTSAGRLLGPGTKLAVRADPDDPASVAIDWDASDEILRTEGVAGLEGTDFGRAVGEVIAKGRDVTPEDIAAMNEAAKRQSRPG